MKKHPSEEKETIENNKENLPFECAVHVAFLLLQ